MYTQDLQRIVDFNMLSDKAIVVGDNVLRPGAPQFMYWNSVAGPYETQVVSLREYKQASSAECFQSLQTISWLLEGIQVSSGNPASIVSDALWTGIDLMNIRG